MKDNDVEENTVNKRNNLEDENSTTSKSDNGEEKTTTASNNNDGEEKMSAKNNAGSSSWLSPQRRVSFVIVFLPPQNAWHEPFFWTSNAMFKKF